MTSVSASGGLRLLHLVLALDAGGTQRLVIEMTKRLRAQAEIAVCCLDEEGEWAHELQDLGVPVSALGRKPGFRPGLARRISGLLRRHRTEVVHCHHYSPFVYGALAAAVTPGVRLVYTEHGRTSDAPPSRKRRLANRLFARLPGRFVAVSGELRRHMLAEGFGADRVEVIHNGIDLGAVPSAADREAARRVLELSPEALVVGTVARFDPVKDLATLLAAFAALAAERPDAVLVLVGDGPERRRLEEIAGELGGSEAIRFIGARDDVRRLLPAFDLYANSSVTEGVSVTILEAMAASLPVVATRVGGNPEVVRDGSTGILVPARRSDRLAEALGALAADPARRASLGRQGRSRAESRFSIARMTDSYLRLYRRRERRETAAASEPPERLQ